MANLFGRGGEDMSTPPPPSPNVLTDMEKDMLRKVGWSDGDPIPDNIPELFQKLSEIESMVQMTEATVAAVDSLQAGPLGPIEAIDEAGLSVEDRAQLYKDVEALQRDEPIIPAAPVSESPKPEQPPEQPDPAANFAEMQEALANIQKQNRQSGAPQLEPQAEVETVDEAPQAVEPEAEQEGDEPPPVFPGEAFSSGEAELTVCPHCTWPLDVPDISEPDEAERQTFLQAVLGLKNFPKQYSLLGGAVRVTFRTLTAPEIDAIYAQAFSEQSAGKIQTAEDFWERINRLRLFLQLQTLESKTFQHNLPDGLSKDTNTTAANYWLEDGETNEETFGRIETKIMKEVLPTESLNRIVTSVCGRFNRLVSKLEAMVDNSDFWNVTEELSLP